MLGLYEPERLLQSKNNNISLFPLYRPASLTHFQLRELESAISSRISALATGARVLGMKAYRHALPPAANVILKI